MRINKELQKRSVTAPPSNDLVRPKAQIASPYSGLPDQKFYALAITTYIENYYNNYRDSKFAPIHNSNGLTRGDLTRRAERSSQFAIDYINKANQVFYGFNPYGLTSLLKPIMTELIVMSPGRLAQNWDQMEQDPARSKTFDAIRTQAPLTRLDLAILQLGQSILDSIFRR